MAGGPQRTVTTDLAVGVVDTMRDIEVFIHRVVALNGIDIGADEEESVTRFVILR